MISTVVVDDDFRVAAIHSAYVEKVPEFSVVARCHTGKDALQAVERLAPDLVLLDLYLPDMHGLEVLRRLREPPLPPVDVIVVTAARDMPSVRAAMQGGTLSYLLKPFGFDALRDKLASYTALRSQLASLHTADQARVDRIYGSLRSPVRDGTAKGQSGPTLAAVEEALVGADCALSAGDVAARTGMSRATAQRYLTHLEALGRATLSLRYGTSGRPEHRYRWSGHTGG